MRTISTDMQAVLDSRVRQYRFTVELWDVLSSGAPTLASIIAGTASSSFKLDVTAFVVEPLTLEAPGDKRAARASFRLMDRTERFNPDGGADAAYLQANQVVRVIEGDEALATSDWLTTFTGHIKGQVGFVRDREGLRFETQVVAYDRRATPHFLKRAFTSQTYGKNVEFQRIVEDIARDQMALGDDELSRLPFGLGKATQFAANSIVDLAPLDAIDKILETVGLVSDFDGNGRLRYYSRDLRRGVDRTYGTLDLIGSIMIPQAEVDIFNSVNVIGLDKQLTEVEQPDQALARAVIPVGFWRPTHQVEVQWSNDLSLRAKNTYMVVLVTVNDGLILSLGEESYAELSELGGRISVDIEGYVASLLILIATLSAATFIVGTFFFNGYLFAVLLQSILLTLTIVSSGQYEIRGIPILPVYQEINVIMTIQGTPDYLVHQREIRNDWINTHVDLTLLAELELLFERSQGLLREFTTLNDLALEIGDIVFLPIGAGLKIWVQGFSKQIARGTIPMMRIEALKVP